MNFKFGDVLLVPFPFTDLSASKKRPAIVVSSELYHHERNDVIVTAVTGYRDVPVYQGDVVIAAWKAAGFLKASIIKPVLTTLEISLVIRKLGALQEDDTKALRSALHLVIG